jgi:predicted transport protein/RecB family endonuclease NucS
MSDIKLFRLASTVQEIQGYSAAVEKSIQTLLEKHLEAILGVRFLASEYATGKTHGGRIDTLGLDENNSPVIIEYKRSLNENVINQGLFYLDWLLDHKAEFKLLVMEKISHDAADKIDWKGTRLLCIAGDFTKYDQHAVQQINRSIELIRYRHYDDDLLLLDLVNATTATATAATDMASTGEIKKSGKAKTVGEYLNQSPQALKDLFEEMRAFLLALGDDVQMKELQFYFAFKRIKNFACVEAHPATPKLLVYVKVDPASVDLKPGFTRDVRNIGHFGTGDLEIVIKTREDFEAAKPFLIASYEAS